MHDTKYRDTKLLEGKRAVIVGYGKTALDLACQAAERGLSCDMVIRDVRWTLPKASLSLSSLEY